MTLSKTIPPAAPAATRARGFDWLWLALGAVLLPLAQFGSVVPVAAWLAPVFLLRFTRSRRPLVALPLIGLVGYGAALIGLRGMLPAPDVYVFALGGVTSVLVYGLDRRLARRLTGLPRTLVFPAADTAVAFLAARATSDFATFGVSAYTQAANLPLVQLVSVTGLWGLSFLISWFAPVANELWERQPSARRVAAVFGAVLVGVLLFGGVRLAFFAPDAPTVRVASLAPDPDLDEAAQADDLFARTQREARAGARIVAWSEAAVITPKQDEAALLDRVAALARDEGIYLQVGLVSVLDTDAYPFNENRAVLFDPDGRLVWDYAKATEPLSDGNAPGPGIVPTVDTPYGRLATVICFDADMPWLVRQAGRAGVDLLLVPSSDWEPVAEVHSRMATFRAVENGTALVRPTRQGTSLAVDAQGRLLGYKPDFFVGEDQTMVTNVPTSGTSTVYARLGDGAGWASVLGILLLAPVAWRRPRR